MAAYRCDPCGISCVTVTYFCLLYGYYVLIGVIIVPLMDETCVFYIYITDELFFYKVSFGFYSLWGTMHGLLFTFLFTLCLFSHLKATFSNPGIIPLSRTALDFSDLHSNTENVRR
jgi:hypothetical protein